MLTSIRHRVSPGSQLRQPVPQRAESAAHFPRSDGRERALFPHTATHLGADPSWKALPAAGDYILGFANGRRGDGVCVGEGGGCLTHSPGFLLRLPY